MSNPDDSSRLSETLERLLGGTPPRDEHAAAEPDAPADAPGAPANGDAHRGESDDTSDVASAERYELPEIVPATDDPGPPPPVSPTLPARAIRPDEGPGRSAAAATATPTTAAATAAAPGSAPPPVAPAPAATSWSDHVAPTTSSGSQLRAPGRRPRVRRVTRVLRHIDPWSTFKVALLFSAVGYVVALTSGVLLWRVADSTGTLDNVERWFTQFGWETFELQGGEIFHNAWIIGLFGVVFATGGAVLLVTLFNLVSDIVGGVRMTVLEEEVVERTASSRRRYIVRSGSDLAAASAVSAPAWSVDDDTDDRPIPPARTGDAAGMPISGEAAAPSSEPPTTRQPATEQTAKGQPARTPTAPPADDDWSVD